MSDDHAAKATWDGLLAGMDNESLLTLIESHKNMDWDKHWNSGPPSKQYVRNWSSYARREARRRGLL